MECTNFLIRGSGTLPGCGASVDDPSGLNCRHTSYSDPKNQQPSHYVSQFDDFAPGSRRV